MWNRKGCGTGRGCGTKAGMEQQAGVEQGGGVEPEGDGTGRWLNRKVVEQEGGGTGRRCGTADLGFEFVSYRRHNVQNCYALKRSRELTRKHTHTGRQTHTHTL